MAEALIKQRVLRALRARGGLWRKMHGHAMQEATLDVIGCYRGRYVELEIKVPGKKPTPRQALIQRLVAAADGCTATVESVADALALLDAIDTTLQHGDEADGRRRS